MVKLFGGRRRLGGRCDLFHLGGESARDSFCLKILQENAR